MIDHAVLLDARADTFPSGLAGTPFETVFLALRMVAADVWDVDPRAYRAAVAWGWYLTHRPSDLAGFRDLLCNALVSEAAPLIKPTQTVEELIGYLSAWREYKPTYGQLEALYGYFAARADIQPVEGERFFYICISGIDWSRPLTYDEAFAIAQRATPLGAFFNIYFRYEDEIQIPVRCADYIGFVYRIGDDYELSRPTGSSDQTLELLLGFKNTGSGWESVQPTSSSKFWAGILSQIDHYEAEKFGLQVYTNSNAGSIGSIVIDYTFGVELLGVYTDTGGSNPVEMGNRWRFVANDQPSGPTTYMAINNSFLFEPNVMTYKARFTKRTSADVEVYFTSGGAGTSGWTNGSIKNVYWGGEYVLFDNGKTYEIVGVYNGETQLSGPFYIGTASTGYSTRIQIKNGSGSTIAIATRVVIRITNRDEREAWLNPDKSNLTMSQNRRVYNSYGNNYVENMERRFEIIRFEDASGNVVTTNNTFSFDTSSYQTFRINITSGPAVTAAKIVYRSIPWTKRAWLKTNRNGKSIGASTSHYIYDEDGHRVLYNDSSVYSVLALYDSSEQPITFTFISLQKYTSDGVDYLVLSNTGSASYEDVAYIIYKES